MAWEKLSNRFRASLAAYEGLPSFDQYYPTLASPSRETVQLSFRRTPAEAREYLNFASSNYLNLNQRPEVRRACAAALEQFGAGANGSPTLSGYYEPHKQLERELSRLHATQDSVLFSSGYCANLSAVTACVGSSDLLLVDERIHGSILDAAKLAGVKLRSFRHNDVNDLDAVLSRLRSSGEIALVATLGVFSMSGDICPLPELIECARRHDALVLLDDAHAVGVLGPSARGTLDHFGLPPDAVDLCVGTLSKTFGGIGGYVSGAVELTEHMRFTARPHVLSAAIPPTTAAGCAAAARILFHEGAELGNKLRARTTSFVRALIERGVEPMGSGTGVAAIPIDRPDALWACTHHLFERGIFLNPVLYPAVRKDEGRLRFYFNIDHSSADLSRAAEVTCDAIEAHAWKGSERRRVSA